MDAEGLRTILIGLTLLLAVGLPIVWIVRQKARTRRVWTEFAEKTGLRLELGRWPKVEGELEGRSFLMGSAVGRTASGGASLNQVNQFYIGADIRGPVPESLIAGKRGRLQGAGPVQTNNPTFDKKIWVDCPDRAAALAYLTTQRQEALLRLAKYDGILKGRDGARSAVIEHVQDGYKVKLDWLDERRREFLAVAGILDV